MGQRSVLKLVETTFETDRITMTGIKQHMLSVENMRQDMMAFFREKLPGADLSLSLEEIQKSSGPKRAYSNKDKFDEMVKKNPLLQDFKDKLGLELN